MIARLKQIARIAGRLVGGLLAIIALPLVMLASRALPATIADEKSHVGNALIINMLCKPALLAIALFLSDGLGRNSGALCVPNGRAAFARGRVKLCPAKSDGTAMDTHILTAPETLGFWLRGGTRGVPPRRGRAIACRGTG